MIQLHMSVGTQIPQLCNQQNLHIHYSLLLWKHATLVFLSGHFELSLLISQCMGICICNLLNLHVSYMCIYCAYNLYTLSAFVYIQYIKHTGNDLCIHVRKISQSCIGEYNSVYNNYCYSPENATNYAHPTSLTQERVSLSLVLYTIDPTHSI